MALDTSVPCVPWAINSCQPHHHSLGQEKKCSDEETANVLVPNFIQLKENSCFSFSMKKIIERKMKERRNENERKKAFSHFH